jgi:hypothetical protein
MLRTGVAVVLAIVLVPAVVVGNASSWALRTVLDDRAFTAAVARSLDQPAVDMAIADAATAIVVDEFARLDPTVRRLATTSMGLGGSPTVDELEGAVHARILPALEDDRVEAARDQVVTGVHGFLLGTATGEHVVVVIDGPHLVVDVGTIVDQAVEVVDPRLSGLLLAGLDPQATRVVVADAGPFQTVQTGVRVLDAVQWIIPLLALLACLVIVVVAHRRTRALGIVGVGLMAAGLVSLAVVWLGGAAVAEASMDATIDGVVQAIYGALTSSLAIQSALLAAAGAVLAIAAWIAMRRPRSGTDRRSGPPPTGAS